MNASAPQETATDEYRRALRYLLHLVLGQASEATSVDWSLVLRIAESERLVALAWHRSGRAIRASAPPAVVDSWRAQAMRVALQVERLISAVADAIDALKGAGVTAVVVKGAPLAQRLYGDGTVRPLADCDLFVPVAQRSTASDVLFSSGWTSRVGEPPAEETFERWADGQRNVIEVHSTIVDDPVLGHVRIPVEQTEIDVAGRTLPAQSGAWLAPSLAAHLAKHETAPLLWVVDFFSLWESMGEDERAAARSAAREVGLTRHLAWACELAAALGEATTGSSPAFERLALLQRALGDFARVRRLVRLSENPLDAFRVLLGRVWPEEWRDSWARSPGYFFRRAAGWIARRSGVARPRTLDNSTARALAVDEEGLAELLAETLGRGLALWIRPRGTSMEPAIPPAAQAHIVPASADRVRPGDVVLARLRHGQFVLHRVVRVDSNNVQLQGDAMRRRDEIVPTSAVVGVCDCVEIEGVLYDIDDRPHDNVALLASSARRRLRRLISAHRP